MGLPPRLWFKLERLKSALRSAWGSKAQAYDAAHRMCPNCRALIKRDASVCPFCGARTGGARSRPSTTPGRVLGGLIPVPSTATSVLVAANVALYGLSWYLTQTLGSSDSGGGISGQVLLRLGAKFGPFMLAGQWWRLVTAMFLHAGLLHIGMNLWCLFDLGPTVESLFSTTKFVFLYLATGVAGFILSLWWAPFGMSVGASGAILGLIGILIGASFHYGRLGRDYRAQLWRWVLYIFALGIFGGFFGFGTDNAAHFGGLVSGVVLGYTVPEGEPRTRASERFWNALAVLSMLVIAGSFALMALELNQPVR
jgi:membrane associated rhomboid family serine protease